MIIPMVMPQVSITTAEVKLISWLKKPGDEVKRGEPVLEVETDKATVEVESYVDGYLRTTNYSNGAIVPLEAVIAIITTTPDEKIEIQSTESKKTDTGAATPKQAAEQKHAVSTSKNGRIEISPVARKLAEANQINVASLKGSGPEGRIIRADVEAAIKAKEMSTAFAMANTPVADSTAQKVSFSSMRSAIAQRTALSKATIPHYYLSVDIDMKSATDLVDNLKNVATNRETEGPTITDVIIWACGKTLPRFPLLLGSWTENGPVVNSEINIGMVVGLEDGLIVPVIRNVDQMSLSVLTKVTKRLKQKARQGGLSSSELTGGTFTISNLGMFGIQTFIAVINPPESAILALGSITKRAVVNENDEVVVRPTMTVTLSVDHRMIDGILASNFLNAFKEVLENPSLILFEQ